MTSEFLLQLALSLIAASIALALLAYAVVLNRRRRQDEPGDVDGQPAYEDVEMDDMKPVEESPTTQQGPAKPKDDVVSIAGLLRHEKTGRLIVKIGEQHFSKAAEIEDPKSLARLKDATADLMQWLSALDDAKAPPEDVDQDKPEKTLFKPKSMIDEINEILELRSERGDAPHGLRLFEGPKSTARVFVGVNSYEVDEVPDDKIRRVIKEAVAEWEARQ